MRGSSGECREAAAPWVRGRLWGGMELCGGELFIAISLIHVLSLTFYNEHSYFCHLVKASNDPSTCPSKNKQSQFSRQWDRGGWVLLTLAGIRQEARGEQGGCTE